MIGCRSAHITCDARPLERFSLFYVKVIRCECGRTEQVEADVRRTTCFRCHARGVGFGFVGGGGFGRRNWSTATIGEAIRSNVGELKGRDDIEYVGRR